MRIAFITHSYVPTVGGKELATHELAKALLQAGHEVRVYVGRATAGFPLLETIDGVPVCRLVPEFQYTERQSSLRQWIQYSLRVVYQFAALIRQHLRFRSDVVHVDFTPDLAVSVLMLCALTHTPCVVTAYGSDLLLLPTQRWYHKRIARRLLASAGAVVAVSHALCEIAIRLVPSSAPKAKVIHVGVELAFFEQFKSDSSLIDSPYILTVGRMEYVKGRDVLLRAFPRVLAKYPDYRLMITGDGGSTSDIKRLAAELEIQEQVVFWGVASRVEVARLLHGCDLLVLPSRSEGMPLAILEAYACSKPVVASRVGGVAEIVEQGRTGFLVEPENEEELASAIIALLDNLDLRQEMGRQAYRIAREHDWTTIADRYAGLFSEVVGPVRG